MILEAGTGALILNPEELAADVLDGIMELVALCSDPDRESPFPPSSGALADVQPIWAP